MRLPTITQAGSSAAASRGGLAVMVAIVALAVIREEGNTAAGLASTLGVTLIVLGAFLGIEKHGLISGRRRTELFVIASLVGFLAASVATINIDVVYAAVLAMAGGFGIWAFANWQPLDGGHRRILVAITLVILGILAAVALLAIEAPRVDVLIGTEAAADALAQGENPYSTVVTPNSNPFAPEGATFDGFFYPPVSLIVYSLSDWLFGDIRWASVAALAAFLVILPQPWRRLPNEARRIAAGGSLAFVLLPFLALIIRYGWTEPLSIPLLAGSALNWRRRPLLAAVLLGFAVASKQYFIVLAPLLLLWRDDYRWKRVGVVGGVAVLTMLPFLLMDPQAFWDAVVGVQFGHPPRPDSTNVIALGLAPPPWLSPVAAMTVAVLLGRRGGDGAEFAVASAAVLGVAFLFGSQAFANYWLLVMALCITALAAAAAAAPPDDRHVLAQQDALAT